MLFHPPLLKIPHIPIISSVPVTVQWRGGRGWLKRCSKRFSAVPSFQSETCGCAGSHLEGNAQTQMNNSGPRRRATTQKRQSLRPFPRWPCDSTHGKGSHSWGPGTPLKLCKTKSTHSLQEVLWRWSREDWEPRLTSHPHSPRRMPRSQPWLPRAVPWAVSQDHF